MDGHYCVIKIIPRQSETFQLHQEFLQGQNVRMHQQSPFELVPQIFLVFLLQPPTIQVPIDYKPFIRDIQTLNSSHLENMVHESRSLQVESWIATIHVVIGRRDFGIVIAFLKFELVKDNESLLSVNNANARFSRCFSLNCSVKGIVLSEPPISSLRNFSGFRTPF